MPTHRVVTLGCKVNQYESQYVKETLENNGYHEAEAHERADLCVVNTCTVTRESDAKGRQLIRRLHSEQPNAAIVVMGCYAARDPQTLSRLPGVAQVIPDKAQLPEALTAYGVRQWPRGIARFDGHQRAFVKVQDGCYLNCSYCIIPHVRPNVISRPIEEIVEEVEGLVAAGYREIVLTGIHLGHYGIDLSRGRPKSEWRRLWHLLRRLGGLPGDFRIRLSSLEAAEARDDLVAALRDVRRVVPHLHLCLQSGSDRVLGAMKRRYRAGGFLERCRRIRQALDQPAFTTDIIVGFPGETEADFEETLRVVREVGFCKIHLFSYSPREGTAAAKRNDLIPASVVHERRQRLLEVGAKLAQAYAQQLVGRLLDVIIEGEDPQHPGCQMGTACRAVTVRLSAPTATQCGQLVRVRAQSADAGAVIGDAVATEDSGQVSGSRQARIAPAESRWSLPLAI